MNHYLEMSHEEGGSAEPDWLTIIAVQYFQTVPLRCFVWPQNLPYKLDVPIQDAILRTTVQSELGKRYSPEASYSLRFLKAILEKVDATGEEHSEVLLEAYLVLLSSASGDKLTGDLSRACYKSYPLPTKISSTVYLTLHEEPLKISQGTTGLCTWEAALRFAEYLVYAAPEVIQGRRILELGAGAGLLGLVCLYMGASTVELTDADEGVLERLKENVDINSQAIIDRIARDFEGLQNNPPNISVSKLDWESVEFDDIASRNAEVIVCADVVYDPILIPPLTSVLGSLLRTPCHVHNTGFREGWVALTMRQEQTYQEFLRALARNRIRYERVRLDCVPELFYHEDNVGEVALLHLTVADS
ncbi:hypothetical protein SpCBS45565_g06641 [Spizellomyces sp. 'palustris']|nr:hypothetical protein SpCBS45565_g06641 [Spizellomyces sp. 'palustris']